MSKNLEIYSKCNNKCRLQLIHVIYEKFVQERKRDCTVKADCKFNNFSCLRKKSLILKYFYFRVVASAITLKCVNEIILRIHDCLRLIKILILFLVNTRTTLLIRRTRTWYCSDPRLALATI